MLYITFDVLLLFYNDGRFENVIVSHIVFLQKEIEFLQELPCENLKKFP